MKSWHKVFLFAFLFTTALSTMEAQTAPKREFRGAWVATVTNIDWPSGPGISSAVQRAQLTTLLDRLAAAGVNAVIFQIRPACDAFYASPYEPWSSWLTGVQGLAPSNDYYDPLVFAAEEAHKRGMEIHAWFNPYRVKLGSNSPSQLAANNVVVEHKDWGIVCPADGYTFLNPGLPQVRNHVAKVISDVVRRYDIDGVHMDDYFYPYAEHGFTNEDLETFRLNPNGFKYPDSLAPWRRNNVNLLIKQMYDSVQVIKPVVKVGMSPFGIWKNGIPAGTSGTSGFDALYCDAVAWLSGKYIDYITPQLYWAFGGGQDYAKLEPWWLSQTNGRHLYPGIITSVGTAQMGLQIAFNRVTNAQGTVVFSARGISGSLLDSLKFKYYASAAAIPVMPWKDTIAPKAPTNIKATFNPVTGLYALTWVPPFAAADGDTARRYLLYRFMKPTYQPADLDVSSNLLALTGQPTVVPSARLDSVNQQYYFAVSALDKNNNESTLSNVVPIAATVATPMLLAPNNLEPNYAKGGNVTWRRDATSLFYRLQVALSGDFNPSSLISTVNTADTSASIGGLVAQTTYYWRVLGGNQGGSGVYSSPWSFRTGWPIAPTLVSPPSGLRNVSRTPTFVWRKGSATSFRIRVTEVTHTPNVLVIDQTTIDTTFLSSAILTAGTNYSWIVSASNAYGASDWSTEARFQTGQEITLVEHGGSMPNVFDLSQNYPNPFNPSTTIRFAVPQSGPVSLRVYDLLGRELSVLLDGFLAPGYYAAQFDGHNLSSGIYFYRLAAPGFVETRKMQLVK
ncbi:MAG: family 10 glycosylhydrolase [Ignavibacteriales bacterium]|nr:family 10 glycosylhydrolase [Ignavibacteriales bacterium]